LRVRPQRWHGPAGGKIELFREEIDSETSLLPAGWA